MDEENEVVKLLVKVGKNINKTEEQLRPFIKKIVEDNWLDSIESLKNFLISLVQFVLVHYL